MENDTTDNKIKISKEIIATLPIETFPGKIVVIDTPSRAAHAVEQLSHEKIIGFDTETRPTFKKGHSNQVALMQLSTHDICYLFRINRIGFTPLLKQLLENEAILKVGISLKDDFCMLGRLNNGQFTPATSWSCRRWSRDTASKTRACKKSTPLSWGKRFPRDNASPTGRPTT